MFIYHNVEHLFQLIQAKMTNMYTYLNMSRSYLYNIARAVDNGIISNKVGLNISGDYFPIHIKILTFCENIDVYPLQDCASLALYLAEACTKVTLDCIQILGMLIY